MASTVKVNGDWVVDVGDKLTQDFDLTENDGPVDNWDDVEVELVIETTEYGTLTLRTDDAGPQLVKQVAAPETVVSITLVSGNVANVYAGRYKLAVDDPTEDERTTHRTAGFRVVGIGGAGTPTGFA